MQVYACRVVQFHYQGWITICKFTHTGWCIFTTRGGLPHTGPTVKLNRLEAGQAVTNCKFMSAGWCILTTRGGLPFASLRIQGGAFSLPGVDHHSASQVTRPHIGPTVNLNRLQTGEGLTYTFFRSTQASLFLTECPILRRFSSCVRHPRCRTRSQLEDDVSITG